MLEGCARNKYAELDCDQDSVHCSRRDEPLLV